MRARRRLVAGLSLTEVMVSLGVMALVSSSVVAGLGFATERVQVARERSIVANHLRGQLENYRHPESTIWNGLVGTAPTTDATSTITISGVRGTVSLARLVQNHASRPGLLFTRFTATWNIQVGSRTIPQRMSLATSIYRRVVAAKTTATLAVKATQTYLRCDQQAGSMGPLSIDLAAYGIAEGAQITIQTTGRYLSYSPSLNTTSQATNAVAVFVSDKTLLSADQNQRAAWAVATGTAVSTVSTTYPNADQHGDFAVGATALTITVPQSARYLLIGTPTGDNVFSDGPGGFQVVVTPL